MPGNKFGARGVNTPDGYFHSKGEYARWKYLLQRRMAGEIQDLSRQAKYELKIDNLLICTYTVDYIYFDRLRNEWVVEDYKPWHDAKNMRMKEVVQMKVRLMKALLNIDVELIKKPEYDHPSCISARKR